MPTLGRAAATLGLQECGLIPTVLTELPLQLCLPPIPRALHVMPHYTRSHLPPSPAESLLFLLLQTMDAALMHTLVVLTTIQFQSVLGADDQTVKVTEELVRQHEEQRRQEMAWLQEMEKRSQELPEIAQGSLLLSACQHWWFWASAEMLLMLFAFYWLPRQDSSGDDSSACGETPAVPKRKRRRRRRRMRMRMCGIACYRDKLHQIRSPDLCIEWKDMQNSEEEMKGMINTSAKPQKPSHKKLLGRAASWKYTSMLSQAVCFYLPKTRLYFRCFRLYLDA